ncbi:uncharacterized protein B0H18DRAFT_40389 [Fomitopsis serialis]|uniref:uncharacterized protein n=1 Tax=Fomitopsis serialis TaxID=139415 RepID=UPI0020077851|nr:uncharacterized protein B0H18DRAFT_40389 [Neoantrodia serialis]KAH9917248.1 hypothetical protein B0H18DRAFT_40389 [Neoantrodia serialis]
MGNSYSIVQQLSREEQEERDYARLVEAVEAAQNAQLQFGQSPDVPAPYGLQGSHPQTSTPGSWPAPTPYQPRQNVRYSTGFVPPSSTLGLLDQTRIPVATSQRPPAQERKSDGSHTMVESPADGRAYAHPDEIEPVCEEACAMPASYTPSSSNVSRGRSLTRHRSSSRPPSRSPDRPVMLCIAPDPPKYPEDSPACVKRTLRSTRRILPRKVPGGCIASPQYRRASSPDSPASRHESMRRSPSIARGCDHCTPSLFARRDTAPECPPEAIPTSRPPSASVVSYRSRSSRVTSLGPRARRSSRSPPQAVIMSVVLRAGTPPRCRDPSPLSRESRRHASRSPSPSTPCLSPQSPLPSEAPSSPPLVATRLPSLSPPPTSRERSMRTEDSVRRRPSETAISVERPPSRRSRSSSPHIDFNRQMRTGVRRCASGSL